MSYNGVVRNGVIVPDEKTTLPEGTRVRVESIARPATTEGSGASFADRVREFAQSMDGTPSDFAEQHDHYLYGRPKR